MYYRVGIIGHGPESFSTSIDDVVSNTICLLANQYKDGLIFNVGSNIGIEHSAMSACISNGYKYHLYLPAPHEITSKYWFQAQQDDLNKYFSKSNAVTIVSRNINNTSINDSYKQLIDHSNFIVYFWLGKKQGKVADMIKYALKSNKLALNGLNDMKLITNNDFIKKRITRNSKSV